jgi:hypothetical protein
MDVDEMKLSLAMRTSLSALAELMVRIQSPPGESLRTTGSAAASAWNRATEGSMLMGRKAVVRKHPLTPPHRCLGFISAGLRYAAFLLSSITRECVEHPISRI